MDVTIMEFAFDDDDDRGDEDRNRNSGDGNTTLPYPADGDRLEDHPAHRDDHSIEQVWFHKARDMSNEDSDTNHEYHHSESRVKLQSTKKDTEVIWSDWSVNLEDAR